MASVDDKVCVVLCTAPDEAVASQLAQALLSARVAACVNVLPGVRSHYWWQGRLEQASEVLLLIKTTRGRFASLQAVLQAAHPYDVPEIIAMDAVDGLPAYLSWVAAEAQQPGSA